MFVFIPPLVYPFGPLSLGPEFAAAAIVPCVIGGGRWGQGQGQEGLARLQSVAGDSQELELGAATAGHSWAGCSGQGLSFPPGAALTWL